MLKISKLADYATVVMTYFAQENSRMHNAASVAFGTKVSAPTVKKLLKLLANAGLLVSQRGTRGGYALSRDPSQISLLHVIAAVEKPTGLTECSHEHHQCGLQSTCGIQSHWRVINQIIQNLLASVTVADLTVFPGALSKIQVQPLIQSVTGVFARDENT